MKIFAVVRNYGVSCGESVFGAGGMSWYEIPDSSLLRSGQPFFVPDFASGFRVFPTVIYRVSRLGKGIGRRFADRYFDAVSIGCCAVAVDLLADLRQHGEPWCRAVAFDRCCMLGSFMPLDKFPGRWIVRCGDNNLEYDLSAMTYEVGQVLEVLSHEITVKEGDMIMAALHPAGLPLQTGTKLSIVSADGDNVDKQNIKILDINIR